MTKHWKGPILVEKVQAGTRELFENELTQHCLQQLQEIPRYIYHFSSVQLLSRVWLSVTPKFWTAEHQDSLSITNSQSLLKLISIESVMQSKHLILCRPFSSCLQSFPESGSFPMSQFFESGGQSIGVSASTSVLPMNIQDWFPLGLTGLISLQSKGLSRVFFNTAVQKHQFSVLSFLYSPTLTSIYMNVTPSLLLF